MNNIYYSREIPCIGEYDVIVSGSGPAGIGTAITSARNGAKTLLVERYGIVGGNLTSGLVGPIMGRVGKGTLAVELNDMLKTSPKIGQDFENLKIILNNWLADSGVEVALQAPIIDVVMEDKAIRGVVVGTANGPAVLKGKVIVDATGDGSVSYFTGAKYEKGRDTDKLMQPVSLMFTVEGVDDEIAVSKEFGNYFVRLPGSGYRELTEKANREGTLPPSISIVRLFRTVRQGECIVNATHMCNIDGTSLNDIAKAELDLRNQIQPVCDFLRRNVDGFQKCYLKDSACTLGVRETRRIIGEYILTDDDIINGRKFDDVVVHNCNFIIDVHNPSGAGQAEDKEIPDYDIPYRCFLPLKIDNLLTAGRCISGTHRANASFRIMNICLAMGNAVGIAAALSARENVTPRKLDYTHIQKVLTDSGVDLYD